MSHGGADAWAHVAIQGNKIYSHKIFRIDYIAYDGQKCQDVIHVNAQQCNMMMLNKEFTNPTKDPSTHPYMYGRVLGIFHANVSFAGPLHAGVERPGFHRLDFAWVHWYDHLGRQNEFSLDRVSPASLDSSRIGETVSFVDPADILRAVHLIPQFSLRKPGGRVPKSRMIEDKEVWSAYYVNMLDLLPLQTILLLIFHFGRFADRDMFMRYQYGMSVGHTYMHTAAFPPPRIPSLPPDFKHYVSQEELASEVGFDLDTARSGSQPEKKADTKGNKRKRKSSAKGKEKQWEGEEEEEGDEVEGDEGEDDEGEGDEGERGDTHGESPLALQSESGNTSEGAPEGEDGDTSGNDEDSDGSGREEDDDAFDEFNDPELSVDDDMFGSDEDE